MRIVYCIAGTYRAAGMERVLADKANALARRGHEVTIITTEQRGLRPAFALDSRIRCIDLGIGYEDNNGASIWNKLMNYPLKQMRHRRRLAVALGQIKPDVTVSMFCNEVNLLPRIKDGSVKILEVHFSRYKRLQYGRKGLWGLADRWRSRQDRRLAGRYSRFVVLTEEDRALWGNLDNICVIPNPVSFYPAEQVSLDAKRVSVIGRLCHQKGQERLVEAWKLVCDHLGGDAAGWRLYIVGDGELREALEDQIDRLGLSATVEMAGVQQDMAEVYRHTSIVALPSRYEGLPMVLLEAQAYGIPAVAFDCPCGPKDVIISGKDGLLVSEGNIQAMAEALLKLMREPALLRRMGDEAYKRAARWAPEPIIDRWEKLFQKTL